MEEEESSGSGVPGGNGDNPKGDGGLPKGGSLQVYDWHLKNLAAFRCRSEGDGESQERLQLDALGHMARFGAEDELLEQLLDGLILNAFKKRPDIGDSAPCRIYGFRNSTKGEEDREFLQQLRVEPDAGVFEEKCEKLAKRYASLPNARQGVLLFLLVTVRAKNVAEEPFLCIFKCDYEEACSIQDKVSVTILNEVIIGKLKKVIIYPHFNGYEHDESHLKLFQSSASDYFEELLWLDKPTVASTLLQGELRRAIALRNQEKSQDEHFLSPPPKKRELFGEERYIPLNDLIPYEEVRFVSDEVCERSKEKFERKVKIQIRIDDNVRIDADMAGLGRSFFFAERGGFRFLIVRGENFTTNGPLSGLDFLDVQSLEDVLPHLDDDGGSVDG